MIGVYLIANVVSGDTYVGNSYSLHDRWRAHISTMRSGVHKNPAFIALADRHGVDSFRFMVIRWMRQPFPPGPRFELERKFIRALKPTMNDPYEMRSAGLSLHAPRYNPVADRWMNWKEWETPYCG